ncbi:sensor domain-containing diguanylate cyclase/phosphohydrolase [Rhodopirellula sallentina]|uniref:diguanylate cyclase n=1 Tax=Rhodopirellula sallentina SM41 TaxID=1263870 RepID=M5U835_9BACT|nr:diguanylate cyclase [Rhodopirellula sallentina]EMI57622.1 Diguanylate cyclase, predicted [Rhodopirellula sallentina SM41]
MNDHVADALTQSPSTVFPVAAPATDDCNAGQSATRLSELLVGLGDAATGELAALHHGAEAPPHQDDSGSRGEEPTDASSSQDTAGDAAMARMYENRLAMVRLGMATSLFYALRTKHAPTAAHSLRVALSCSAWCERLGLSDEERDRIEVAALLHDIGKIGIPDRILRKPGKLTVEEQMTMDCCAELGCEILRGCTDDQSLLEIVRYNGTWFESRRQDDTVRGDALPLGARMLSVAGAFDAMTTDQVYRGAMSRERALQELFRGSNTQFDPELTRDFATMLEKRPEMLHGCVVDRWLQQLQNTSHNLLGKPVGSHHAHAAMAGASENNQTLASIFDTTSGRSSSIESSIAAELLYYETLGDHLRDGVAFTNREGEILYWNDSLAQMTRIAAVASVGTHWDSEELKFAVVGKSDSTECPVNECLQRQIVVTRNMKLLSGHSADEHEILDHRDKLAPSKPVSELPGRDVLVHVAPVENENGGGAVVIVRDISDRAQMQSQIQTLHKKATSDPLTGVANRAEFDQRLTHSTTKAKQQGITFSLIMCDIDHFKKVNDIHGHQAGDEALIQFANVLESHTRGSDLVARYGGEEFAFLAIGSDNATATRRAEEIREAIAATPLKGLDGESVTISMGVTEFQTGDAPETIVARADRALMQAKENGRNRVVQLGSGFVDTNEKSEPSGWLSWFTSNDSGKQQEFELATPVPTDLAVEKLRGFISDHRAEIINVHGNELSLRLNVSGGNGRRAADHRMTFNTLIRLSESRGKRGIRGASLTQTQINVTITPLRGRDRRSASFGPCVRQVVNSLKSYLMAEIVQADD